jgi:hypothetical protein
MAKKTSRKDDSTHKEGAKPKKASKAPAKANSVATKKEAAKPKVATTKKPATTKKVVATKKSVTIKKSVTTKGAAASATPVVKASLVVKSKAVLAVGDDLRGMIVDVLCHPSPRWLTTAGIRAAILGKFERDFPESAICVECIGLVGKRKIKCWNTVDSRVCSKADFDPPIDCSPLMFGCLSASKTPNA